MDNFKYIILSLLIICLLGFADTNYFSQKIIEHKIIKHYRDKAKIIGFGVEENGNYIKVKEVLEDTPAEKAGILSKDIIVSLNYKKVTTLERFLETLTLSDPEKNLVIGILRAGENHIMYITLCPECLPRRK